MQKTLITGGTGYLGQRLLDSLLADGVPVRALVYSEWKGEELADRGVEVFYGDVTDPSTLGGIADEVDTVFHLVGGGNDGRQDPFQLNTEGTRNVAEACRKADLSAFVYVSSSSVYGRQHELVDEDTPPAPRIDYPQSKLEAENVLLEKARESGFPVVIARMGGIYGPEAPMLATDLARKGQLRVTGDGQNTISVIHVEDAVRVLRAMADHGRQGKPGRLFCVADDEPVQVLPFHNYLACLLEAPLVRTTSIRRLRILMGILGILSHVVGRKPPLTEAIIEMSTLNVRMKNDRMRRDLGLDLFYPTYREGLMQVVEEILMEEEE